MYPGEEDNARIGASLHHRTQPYRPGGDFFALHNGTELFGIMPLDPDVHVTFGVVTRGAGGVGCNETEAVLPRLVCTGYGVGICVDVGGSDLALPACVPNGVAILTRDISKELSCSRGLDWVCGASGGG